MPEFGSPFSGLANDRILTSGELVRAIRLMVAAEYEAIQLYTQLAESTDNRLAVEVLTDIANEERVHAGEFLSLLREIAPDEETFYAKGAKEVEAEIGKIGEEPHGKASRVMAPTHCPPASRQSERGTGCRVQPGNGDFG
jgi:rubrerythrin